MTAILIAPGTRKKQVRIATYSAGDGKLLFVPTLRMWKIHYAAAKCRFTREYPLRELRRRIEAQAGVHIPQQFFRLAGLRGHPWFVPWLFYGRSLPDCVSVATRQMVHWAGIAWDYIGHCEKANMPKSGDMYRAWWDRSLLPQALPWLSWLYGGPGPQDCYIVPEAVLKLRMTRGEQNILEAAAVSRRTVHLWRRDKNDAAALQAALEAASRSGHQSSLDQCAEWRQLNPKAKASMWRFAKVATIRACSIRANISDSTYPNAKRKAEQLGVGDHLDRFLAIERGKKARKCGMLAPGFFAPSPSMVRFREAARNAAASVRVEPMTDLPGFEQWFFDSAIGRAMKGIRRRLSARVPNIQGQPAASPVAIPPAAVDSGEKPQARKRGRRPHPRSTERKRVCHECYARVLSGEWKMRMAMQQAQKELGPNAPKEPSHLRRDAKRYASSKS
jgi:hypothetical protein